MENSSSKWPNLVGARHYKGEDVVQTLERTCRQIGYPVVIRVDNGSEFISRVLDLRAYHKGVVLDFSRPGKPTDNSFMESFNGIFRSEFRNGLDPNLPHRPSVPIQRGFFVVTNE